MRIISKKEIKKRSKSLAGTSAMKIYVDGNFTISTLAAKLMNLKELPFLQLVEDECKGLYLFPNKTEGFKPRQRKGKYTYIMIQRSLATFISKFLNKKIAPYKPLELTIKKTSKEYQGNSIYQLIPVRNK